MGDSRSHPTLLVGDMFQNPFLHRSHREPMTFCLHKQSPACLPWSSSSWTHSEALEVLPSLPNGSQSHSVWASGGHVGVNVLRARARLRRVRNGAIRSSLRKHVVNDVNLDWQAAVNYKQRFMAKPYADIVYVLYPPTRPYSIGVDNGKFTRETSWPTDSNRLVRGFGPHCGCGSVCWRSTGSVGRPYYLYTCRVLRCELPFRVCSTCTDLRERARVGVGVSAVVTAMFDIVDVYRCYVLIILYNNDLNRLLNLMCINILQKYTS